MFAGSGIYKETISSYAENYTRSRHHRKENDEQNNELANIISTTLPTQPGSLIDHTRGDCTPAGRSRLERKGYTIHPIKDR